jgi:hypothetical protein
MCVELEVIVAKNVRLATKKAGYYGARPGTWGTCLVSGQDLRGCGRMHDGSKK